MEEFMKEFVEYLKKRTAEIVQNNEPKSVGHIEAGFGCVISYDQAKIIIDFYEKTANISEYTEQELNRKGCMGPCGQCESEQPNAPDITPEWDKIPERFKWVCIDRDGEEIAHQYEPGVNGLGFWMQKIPFLHGEERKTGRFFDMTNIDWTKTLSKRPAK